MTERARREYAEALRPRYAQADKRGRGHVLDEYCQTTGMHRKAAIRCLRRTGRTARRAPGRPRRYAPELAPTLERVWLASDRLCGKLLAPVLPTYLQALERHHGLVVPTAVRRALVSASPATLERLLQPLRRQRRRQPYRASPGVAALRQQIPLRTWNEWTAVAPGALQGDLVLHCGEATGGFYLATLLAIDVATTWTELEIVWGIGAAARRHRSASHPAALAGRAARVAQRQWRGVHQRRPGGLVSTRGHPLHAGAALSQKRSGLG
ncbi:MAG: hypothetical protein ACREKS_10275 [Candidatus Rokuibacteriota bacterium]